MAKTWGKPIRKKGCYRIVLLLWIVLLKKIARHVWSGRVDVGEGDFGIRYGTWIVWSLRCSWNRSHGAESASWSGIVLLGWTCSLGASSHFRSFFLHFFLRLEPFLLFSWIGTYAPFPSGTIQPQSFPVKTHKFEWPMFPTCFPGLHRQITRGFCHFYRVALDASNTPRKHMEKLAPRTGDCKVAMLWSGGFLPVCTSFIFSNSRLKRVKGETSIGNVIFISRTRAYIGSVSRGVDVSIEVGQPPS